MGDSPILVGNSQITNPHIKSDEMEDSPISVAKSPRILLDQTGSINLCSQLMAKIAAQPKESEKPPHAYMHIPSHERSIMEGFLCRAAPLFAPEKASFDAN
ncbi:hypothetical protein CEXT_605441 [Caerostris extrusa]|uniref:Uncharacterized protein n=1 Tax=Caerostris extrusa TaxID=172846 RepID=A0AAV4V7S9_CAEEX|nr:hypothetical protein CEXT_605441 [Caerostris extrusa]